MNTVNRHYLPRLLIGLTGMADDDAFVKKYRSVNSDDPLQMKVIIENDLKPEFFRQIPRASLPIVKLTLQYHLTNGGVDWQRLFDSHLLPFNSPADPRDFFIWIWEVFFPGERYKLDEVEGIVESDDPDAPMRDARAEPRGWKSG